MILKCAFSKSNEEEIAYIIKKHLSKILHNTALIGSKEEVNWEDNISAESLTSVISNNVCVSHNCNLISFSKLGITEKLIHVMQREFPQSVIKPSGFFHYPKTGYMGWHTNSDSPGRRLYITYTDVGGESFFRYKDIESGKIVTDYDNAGLTFREFAVYEKPPYLWHSVGSNCNRFSFGFIIA
jgi:hypothetical protein